MKRAERTGRNVQHMKKANASRFRRQLFVFIFVYSLLLVSGFFLFGNQHFASMDYVMKNSSLLGILGITRHASRADPNK